ncbi:MAG: glycosyltransferase [Betaproteobacteria bacterium]|nr:glycosyltransferase [Betaproteobacteria bacterium]
MTNPTAPAVSVVVPCHNAAAFLGRTLTSILAQSWRDLEVLVVDDGSSDDTAAVVGGIADARVRFWRQAASGGPSAPRNRAIAAARGRYVFFCDADDVMKPGKIERQVAILAARPAVALVFTDFEVVDEDDRLLEPSFLAAYSTLRAIVAGGEQADGSLRRDLMVCGLIRANFIGTSSVAVRRDVLAEVGVFDESLASSEDLDLWLRIARRHGCAFLDIVGHAYRRHAGSLMHEAGDRHPLARIEVMRRQLGCRPSSRERRLIRYWLGRNYCALGYLNEKRGNWAEARAYYVQSLRVRPGLLVVWGWVRCLARELLRGRGDGAA